MTTAAPTAATTSDDQRLSFDDAIDRFMLHDPRDAPANASLDGLSIRKASERTPLLLVMLRHTGCPFCSEAVGDIVAMRDQLHDAGVQPVFVHMGAEEGEQGAFIARYFAARNADDIPRVSDPDQRLYDALELKRGNLWQLFGPHVLVRVIATIARGVRPAKQAIGDAFQLPGVFLIERGEITRSHVHRAQSDRPNYQTLACPVGSG